MAAAGELNLLQIPFPGGTSSPFMAPVHTAVYVTTISVTSNAVDLRPPARGPTERSGMEAVVFQVLGGYLIGRDGHLVGRNFIGDRGALGAWACRDFFENRFDRRNRPAGPNRKPEEIQPAISAAIHPGWFAPAGENRVAK